MKIYRAEMWSNYPIEEIEAIKEEKDGFWIKGEISNFFIPKKDAPGQANVIYTSSLKEARDFVCSEYEKKIENLKDDLSLQKKRYRAFKRDYIKGKHIDKLGHECIK
jgi:hypothetical protein